MKLINTISEQKIEESIDSILNCDDQSDATLITYHSIILRKPLDDCQPINTLDSTEAHFKTLMSCESDEVIRKYALTLYYLVLKYESQFATSFVSSVTNIQAANRWSIADRMIRTIHKAFKINDYEETYNHIVLRES